eukprot:6190569-Pleurochrysis_carterae.AAC.2
MSDRNSSAPPLSPVPRGVLCVHAAGTAAVKRRCNFLEAPAKLPVRRDGGKALSQLRIRASLARPWGARAPTQRDGQEHAKRGTALRVRLRASIFTAAPRLTAILETHEAGPPRAAATTPCFI